MPTRDIPSGTAYVSGDTAPAVRTKLNDNLTWAEAQMQGIEDRHEVGLSAILGSGVLTGLAVSGSGLSVDVAAGTAIIGHVVEMAATTGVAVTASDDTYLYLMQNGTFEANTTGVKPTSQSCILLAIATADATSVTSVDNAPAGKEMLSLVPDLGSGEGITSHPLGADWVDSDSIDWGTAAGQVSADDVPVATAGFGEALSASETTVQAALDALDDHTHPGAASDEMVAVASGQTPGYLDGVLLVDSTLTKSGTGATRTLGLADGGVSEAKLDVADAPATDELLAYNGTKPEWRAVSSAAGVSLVVESGAVSVGTDKLGFDVLVPFAATVQSVRLRARTGPVGAALIVDVNVNGTSIWSTTPANRVQIGAGSTSGSQTSFDTTSLSAGDVITVDVDQVGSTTAGSDLTLALELEVSARAA